LRRAGRAKGGSRPVSGAAGAAKWRGNRVRDVCAALDSASEGFLVMDEQWCKWEVKDESTRRSVIAAGEAVDEE